MDIIPSITQTLNLLLRGEFGGKKADSIPLEHIFECLINRSAILDHVIYFMIENPRTAANTWLTMRLVCKSMNIISGNSLYVNLSSIRSMGVLFTDDASGINYSTPKFYVFAQNELYICSVCGTKIRPSKIPMHKRKCPEFRKILSGKRRNACKLCLLQLHPILVNSPLDHAASTSFCPLKRTTCGYCYAGTNNAEYITCHKELCGNVVDKRCNFCKETFARSQIQNHSLSCIERYAPCLICGDKIYFNQAKKKNEHDITCKIFRLRKISEAVNKQIKHVSHMYAEIYIVKVIPELLRLNPQVSPYKIADETQKITFSINWQRDDLLNDDLTFKLFNPDYASRTLHEHRMIRNSSPSLVSADVTAGPFKFAIICKLIELPGYKAVSYKYKHADSGNDEINLIVHGIKWPRIIY